MFVLTRKELENSLESIRKKLCAYLSLPCDCKYITGNKVNDEETGCCELLNVLGLLRNMTDEEYERIIKRTRNMILN